ncbi:MAG: PEP-CTERM sorting domain-containing protein [Armatimonadota bacterium]|nr:hypothetical protein [bacterium]
MIKFRALLLYAVVLIAALSSMACASIYQDVVLDSNKWDTSGICTYDLDLGWSWGANGAVLARINDAKPTGSNDPRIRQNITNQTEDIWTDWHVEISNGTNLRNIVVNKVGVGSWTIETYQYCCGFFAHLNTTYDPNNPLAIHQGEKLYVEFTYDVLDPQQPVSILQYPTTNYTLPEPASLLTMLAGVGGMLGIFRRKR